MNDYQIITATETDARVIYDALHAAGYYTCIADCVEIARDNQYRQAGHYVI